MRKQCEYLLEMAYVWFRLKELRDSVARPPSVWPFVLRHELQQYSLLHRCVETWFSYRATSYFFDLLWGFFRFDGGFGGLM